MADILNNNNLTPPQNPPTSPVQPSPNVPAAPVNTGKQYEVNTTDQPEDLDMMWNRWKCLVCNYTYEGAKPLKKCPRCGNEDPDKFGDES